MKNKIKNLLINKIRRINKKRSIYWYLFRKSPRKISTVILKSLSKYVSITFCVNILIFILWRLLLGSTKITINNFSKTSTVATKSIIYGKRLIQEFYYLAIITKKFLLNMRYENNFFIMQDLPTVINQLGSYLRDFIYRRYRDLKIILKMLWRNKFSLKRFFTFLAKHIHLFKRIFRAFLEMLFGFLAKRLAILFIIPLLGISTITVIGIELGNVAVGVLSLIISQVGILLGRKTCYYIYKITDINKLKNIVYTIALFYQRFIKLIYQSIKLYFH